ncbi:glutathione gamma-glutamylcysteinyltransferase 3-like [Cucumis melo var. makuwa]|uniref:glutathione gamma-glutamylcysteinyltransferase n=1 Tax=Cucumis melo var. makuwa TaxID=1194695 RepID=A0A5A7TWX8_CUCMM|nr:glutathione gamma-glutamylcysteinyltransferase 3-like [Cucumis melo var. makuwa]
MLLRSPSTPILNPWKPYFTLILHQIPKSRPLIGVQWINMMGALSGSDLSVVGKRIPRMARSVGSCFGSWDGDNEEDRAETRVHDREQAGTDSFGGNPFSPPQSHPTPPPVTGFYRRVLPSPPAIDFTSFDGQCLLEEALGDGTMKGFCKLISCHQTQPELTYCGLTTLAIVLNALSIDPGGKWKGPWRWFDETMLDCCEPLAKIKTNGITFDEAANLARCNGAKVKAIRKNESTVDDFRKHVISCSSSSDRHVIASYHKGVLKQTGAGRFSPIGGYHAGKDMVLILDVARFKYPFHWVPLTLLWDAMNTLAIRLPRGYMILSK